MSEHHQHPQRHILNGRFHAVTQSDTLAWAEKLLDSAEKCTLTTVNVSILMMMRKDKKLASFVQNSTMTVADGQPIIWLSKILRKPLPERVTGIDLCLELMQLAEKNGKSIYLLGATNDIIVKVADNLRSQYPNLDIAGMNNGYFTPSNFSAIVQDINKSGADILFVAMGVPRQEFFIQDHWDDLNVKLAIPVGGSFDVIAGQTSRAPKWMQLSGLEWLFRLIQEPKRLAKRYAISNSQFIWFSIKAIMRL